MLHCVGDASVIAATARLVPRNMEFVIAPRPQNPTAKSIASKAFTAWRCPRPITQRGNAGPQEPIPYRSPSDAR
jgi:hypothetical protein